MANTNSIIPFGRMTHMGKEYRGFYVGGSEEQSAYYIISRKTFLNEQRDYQYDYALFATREQFDSIWNMTSAQDLASGDYKQQMFVGPSLSILINEYLRVEDVSSDGGTIGGGSQVGGATSANQVAQTQVMQALLDHLHEHEHEDPKPTPVINGDTPLLTTSTITGRVQAEIVNFPEPVAIQKVEITNPSAAVEVQKVEITNHPQAPENQLIHGTVSVDNFPAYPDVQRIQGEVTIPALPPIGGSVAITNLPTQQHVLVDNLPAKQVVEGTVSISNLPATQPVSGSVSIQGDVTVKNTAPLEVRVINPSTTTGGPTEARQTQQIAELVGVNQKLAAPLRVIVDNPTTSVSISNPVTTVTVANPVTSVTTTSEVFISKVVTSQLLAANNVFVIKNTPGVVKRVIVSTTASAARVISVFNKASAPTSTDAPIAIVTIPATPTPSQPIDLNINCSQGIVVVIGSAVGLLGAVTSILGLNDCVVTVCYT